MSDERNSDTLQIVGFKEGGKKVGRDGNHRLVCNIKGGGQIVIWGKESMDNINAVLNAGLPCTVECDTIIPPKKWRTQYGDTHWVPEYHDLRVLYIWRSSGGGGLHEEGGFEGLIREQRELFIAGHAIEDGQGKLRHSGFQS